MSLRSVNNLLSVVEQEGSEEDESSVHGDRVEASSHSSGGGEEGRADTGAEDNSWMMKSKKLMR